MTAVLDAALLKPARLHFGRRICVTRGSTRVESSLPWEEAIPVETSMLGGDRPAHPRQSVARNGMSTAVAQHPRSVGDGPADRSRMPTLASTPIQRNHDLTSLHSLTDMIYGGAHIRDKFIAVRAQSFSRSMRA